MILRPHGSCCTVLKFLDNFKNEKVKQLKKLKNITAAKKLTILAVIILSIFAGINLFWLLIKALPDYGYANKVDKTDTALGTMYTKKIGKYEYRVDKATYLGYDGFLSVGEPYELYYDNGSIIDSSGLNIRLFIWPKVTGRYEYGVFFIDEVKDISTQIYIDKNTKFIPYKPETLEYNEYNEKAEKLINENYDDIKAKMDGAKELWGLNGLGDILTGLKVFINDISIKHILIFFTAAAALFAIMNLFWLFITSLLFRRFAKKLIKVKENKTLVYQKAVNGYLYEAERPKYLRYGFLLCVRAESKGDETASDLTLHIRCGLTKNKQYTIFLNDPLSGESECIPINRDIEYDKKRGNHITAEKTPEEKRKNELRAVELIDKHFTEIKAMMYGAKNLWSIIL